MLAASAVRNTLDTLLYREADSTMNMEKRKEKQSHFRSIEQILVSFSLSLSLSLSLFLSLSLSLSLSLMFSRSRVSCRVPRGAAPRFET
jgi:hypothetical protein